MEEDDEMINVRKADENIEQTHEQQPDNVKAESTRLKKQKMKEKILEKVNRSSFD